MGRLKVDGVRVWTGRGVALGAAAAAIALSASALGRLDRRPRTQDAFLYADSVGVAPEVSGRILAFHVQENQRIPRGAAVAQIDPKPFGLRVEQAHAQVAALQAEIALTSREIKAQTSGAAAAAAQIRRARSQLSLAQDTVGRLSPLLPKGYATTQQLDEAITNENVAQAALAASIQQAAQAREAIGDTDALHAQLAAAEAVLALAERDLENTTLRAPFDGFVVGLDTSEGAFASAGRPLFTLVKADDWYAIGNFRETELAQISVGDPARVWLLAQHNQSLDGHVESLGRGVRPDEVGPGPGLPAVGRTLNWVTVAQRFPVRVRLDRIPAEWARLGTTASIAVSHDPSR
jgi:multidrug efflux system membrane fusion protein